MRRHLGCLLFIVTACGTGSGSPTGVTPSLPAVTSVRELGVIPDPPGAVGRDAGVSALFGGHSVWLFGDTFFSQPASDGLTWRGSSWSWTHPTDASSGLTQFTHGLDAQGKPLQAIPNTPDEEAYDVAHNGSPCPAASGCGGRHTPWPAGGFVMDPATGSAWVFYSDMSTQPTGDFSFQTMGTGIAVWPSPAAPATRPDVGAVPADPTYLFGPDEPMWGNGAILVDGQLYAYACQGAGVSGSSCLVARVASGSVLDRSAWRFWDGTSWNVDWHAAVGVFDGAPFLSVVYNAHASSYLAWYMPPFDGQILVRTAPAPLGPWSEPVNVGRGLPSLAHGNWDYGLLAHPELDQDGGRIVYLSYDRPASFLGATVNLVQVTFQ